MIEIYKKVVIKQLQAKKSSDLFFSLVRFFEILNKEKQTTTMVPKTKTSRPAYQTLPIKTVEVIGTLISLYIYIF